MADWHNDRKKVLKRAVKFAKWASDLGDLVAYDTFDADYVDFVINSLENSKQGDYSDSNEVGISDSIINHAIETINRYRKQMTLPESKETKRAQWMASKTKGDN